MDYADLFVTPIRSLGSERRIAITKPASMSGVKQSTPDNTVRGNRENPGVQTIHKIANAFIMTPAEFWDFDELNAYSFEQDEDE